MEKKNQLTEGIDPLYRTLNAAAPLPEEIWQVLNGSLETAHAPKGTHLLRPGDRTQRIYFIMHGMVRAYYLDKKGNEKTIWFMQAGDVMISVRTFFANRPSAEYVEVLEDAELRFTTKATLEKMYKACTAFNLHGRLMTEKYYVRSEERQILKQTASADERYQALLEQMPDIEQRVPLSMVASYLGITQVWLSNLRARRHK